MWSVCIICWTFVGLTIPITAFPDTRTANGKAATNNSRIIGGADAQPGEWPWQAMIEEYNNNKGKFEFSCGGSLISNMWVLSAAHCFETSDVTQFRVVLGAYLADFSDSNWIRKTPQAILCHSQYDDDTSVNDICLVQLPSAVEYTDYISPVSLPSAGDVTMPDETCVITGWGETELESSATKLQEADVRVFPISQCKAWWSENKIFVSEKAHMCAGTTDGSKDAGGGDSGGPLVCKRIAGSDYIFTLFGITCFGVDEYPTPNRPGVYTNVPDYLNWIASTQESTKETDIFFVLMIVFAGTTVIFLILFAVACYKLDKKYRERKKKENKIKLEM